MVRRDSLYHLLFIMKPACLNGLAIKKDELHGFRYIDKYPSEIIDMYNALKKLIFDSILSEPQEIMWAKLPSYYVGESFVRLIPFKDHINIEAKAVLKYADSLAGYKVTPKGMLQIFVKQEIPVDVLKRIFAETLV